MPPSEELLVHVLFDLLCHFLLVGTIFKSMVDDMLGLELDLRLHLREHHLDSPLFGSLIK